MENLTKNDISIGKYGGLGLFVVSLADIATFLTGAEERIALIAYGPVSYTHLTLPTIYSV